VFVLSRSESSSLAKEFASCRIRTSCLAGTFKSSLNAISLVNFSPRKPSNENARRSKLLSDD
jgi:hypothetical protein